MLSDQQVETFIYQFRQQIAALQVGQIAQNATDTGMQASLSKLQAQVDALPTTQGSAIDTYIAGGQIIHRLATLFQAAVTFATNVLIKGTLTLTNALTVANGGTSSGTLTNHAVLIGKGTAALGFATVGTSGNVLTDNGAAADPTFQALPADWGGQIVQSVVTGSRTLATPVHNTGTHPIVVFVSVHKTGGVTLAALSDGTATPSTQSAIASSSGTEVVGICFIVLAGNYYQVTASGATVDQWTEWV